MKKRNSKSGFRVSPAHESQKRIFGETGAYLKCSLLNPHKNKWGITDKMEARRAQIDKDVPGPVYTIFGRTIMFGWLCEQFVHWLYQKQRAPMKTGTGRLEWYYTFSPVFGASVCAVGYYLETVFPYWVYLVSFFQLWIWIDGLLWLLFFRLIGWLTCIGLALLTYHVYLSTL